MPSRASTCPALYALVGPESEGLANWSDATDLATEVGSAYAADFPDASLDISGPGEESGTYDTFVEFAIGDLAEERGQDEVTRADYASSPNDNLIVDGIESSESSLGWIGFAFYAAEQERMKAIEIDAGDGCVAPTEETIADASYPFSRSLFIYVNTANAESNPAVASFVDLYLSDEGLAAVTDSGYVALPEDRITATRDAWSGADRRRSRPDRACASTPGGDGVGAQPHVSAGTVAAVARRSSPRGGRPRRHGIGERMENPTHDAHRPGPAGQPQAAQPRADDAGRLPASPRSPRSPSAC